MSEPKALLDELGRHGIELRAEGDRLRYRPADAISPGLLTQLRVHKAELLAILSDNDHWARQAAGLLATVADPDLRVDLRKLFEHRAAVCEYVGGLSRTDAERVAFAELQAAMRKAGEKT